VSKREVCVPKDALARMCRSPSLTHACLREARLTEARRMTEHHSELSLAPQCKDNTHAQCCEHAAAPHPLGLQVSDAEAILEALRLERDKLHHFAADRGAKLRHAVLVTGLGQLVELLEVL